MANFQIMFTLNELAEVYKQMLLLSEIPCDKEQLNEMAKDFKKDMQMHKNISSNYPMSTRFMDIFEKRASLEYNKLK